MYVLFRRQLPQLAALTLIPTQTSIPLMMHFLCNTCLQLLLALLVLAFIDKKYSLWKFHQEQRMSKQELKDEYKQREGDPKIKYKRKQLHLQLRQKTASLLQVKTADVVITNPTHIAIALKYERQSMPAPKVVCKAQDAMALAVKKLAKKHGVPLIEDRTFARLLLHGSELNHYVDQHLFSLTATVYRQLYEQGNYHVK